MFDNNYDSKDANKDFLDDDIITGEPENDDFDLDFSDSDIEISNLKSEIEELKKMVSQNQSRYQSAYSSGSEVALYNELSRLREDIAKTQSNQNIQMEIGKLRDEMEYSAKRSDEKIHNLLEKVQVQIASMDQSSKNRAKGGAYLNQKGSQSQIDESDLTSIYSIYSDILAVISNRSNVVLEKVEELKNIFTGNGTIEGVKLDEEVLKKIIVEIESIKSAIDSNSKSFSEFDDLKKAQKELIGSINQISMDVRSFNEKGSINLTPILIDLDTISNKIADEDRAISEFSHGLNGVEKIDKIIESLNSLTKVQNEQAMSEREHLNQVVCELTEKLDSINAVVSRDDGSEENMILGEIVSLRDELQTYKDELSSLFGKKDEEQEDVIGDVQVIDDNNPVLDSIISIKNDIAELSDKIVSQTLPTEKESSPQAIERVPIVNDELNQLIRGLYEKLDEIKQSQAKIIVPTPTVDNSNELIASLISEIKGLKNEISELKTNKTVVQPGEIRIAAQDLAEIKEVKQHLLDVHGEPDYVVMNEVLALRDEFQSMKEQLMNVNSSVNNTSSNDAVAEIRNLRDQIFAINMASVSNGDEQSYDSYNNLILGEIESMRDDIDEIKKQIENISNASGSSELADGNMFINEVTTMFAKTSKSSREAILNAIEKVKDELIKANTPKQNDSINKNFEELRQSNDAQTELGMASLNLLTKIAKVVDEQNNYLASLKSTEDNGQSKVNDDDLEKSLNELKDELSHMAGITESEQKKTKKNSKKK